MAIGSMDLVPKSGPSIIPDGVLNSLDATECDGQEFHRRQQNYDHDTDWWTCWTENNEIHGAGGPWQLTAVIETCREWVESLS